MSLKAISLSRILRKSTKVLWKKQSLEHLESVRRFELEFALHSFPDSGRILEIGAGTGWQAKALQVRGLDVDAIDLSISHYKDDRVFPVVDYDGHNIPFSDDTFDMVFSSNVMEHIPHLEDFQKELHRVLNPGGIAVHIVPSSSWRFWTNITHILKTWTIPEIHGEHAKNALDEIRLFRKNWWRQLYEQTDWQVIKIIPCPIFYTGRSIMGERISIPARHRLSQILGGSTSLFVLRSNI